MLTVSAENLANLNDAILINLKPNEDSTTNANPFLPMSPMDALRSGNTCIFNKTRANVDQKVFFQNKQNISQN